MDQPDFTNGAVKIKTEFNQSELNKRLKDIEDQIGRDRTNPKFGPHCIDLDIAVWNGEIVDDHMGEFGHINQCNYFYNHILKHSKILKK